ncbi:MAG: hypothetical protein AAGG44_05150 [Planctomycetota bacterium]
MMNSDAKRQAQTNCTSASNEAVSRSEWKEALSDRPTPKVFVQKQGNPAINVAGLQLTLGELFFVTTLCALAFWVYNWVSPILATICGCLLIFVAVMRAVGRRPAFMGGLIGFGVAGVITLVACLFAQATTLASALCVTSIASIGYILGAIMTELADDDSI